MDGGIQVDVRGLQAALKDLKKTGISTGLTVQWLVWDTCRLACNDAIKYTAPWAGENTLGTFGAQKKTGKGAVAHDIDSLFARIDKSKYTYFVNKGNGKRYYKDNATGVVTEIAPELWKPNDIKAIHIAARNRRGRVKRPARQAVALKSKINRYIKEVQAGVGRLKAGWVPSLNKFAGLTRGKKSVPKWVDIQKGSGAFFGDVNRAGNGHIKMSNTTSYSHAIRRGTIMFIERKRNKDINGNMRKRMRTIAKRFNAGQASERAVTA